MMVLLADNRAQIEKPSRQTIGPVIAFVVTKRIALALQRNQELHSAQCELPRSTRDFPDACDSPAAGARPVHRRELFLQSKVWPTELGYGPTSAAIATSMRLLQSNYVDLYMLHWPV